MPITITQIFLSIFLLFALSRVILRFRDGTLPLFGFFFWSSLFGLATIMVLFPGITSNIAQTMGIGRGADVIIYLSITILFYLVFRLYIYLEDIKHNLTELVQKLALKKNEKKNVKKATKD